MLAALLGLSACDPGPECVRSHMETQWVTVIGYKGSVSMHPVFVSVCDQYAKTK
jgi:hypothetical protein